MSVCKLTLALLVMQLGLAKCFSWDIVVSEEKRLKFYNNGTVRHTEDIPSANQIYSIIYDPVHYRILFADRHNGIVNISSFELTTRNIQHLVMKKSSYYLGIAYDPVTQLLFWPEDHLIYSYSINPAYSYKANDGTLLVTLETDIRMIAVDSCGRYIYWISDKDIGRVPFDGSKREVLINSIVWLRLTLAIDHQTQTMYWTEMIKDIDETYIESADLNGKKRRTIYTIKNEYEVTSLAVSKDFIYWEGYYNKAIWQLPKNHSQQLEAKIISKTNIYVSGFLVITTNYTVKDQIKENQKCEALKNLIPNESEPDYIYVKMLCVHGTKVSGESRCECAQGYTGERCDISSCQNYCLQGNCSLSAEGQPKCSCKAGYSGQRCEVNACHGYCLNSGVCSLDEEDAPVCQCTADFEGETCGVSICKDYCLEGNCSVSAEGQPICSCKAGYSGRRCEVNACHVYCLNGGICSLNEEDNPVCQCTIDYEGERCGVPICKDYCFQGNCNVSAEGQPICRCTDGYSGERCEFNACHDYCFNNGVCFLNEEEQTVCQCTADYEGERCDVAVTHTVMKGDNMTQQILRELRSEVTQVIKEQLQSSLRSCEENQFQVIKEELQRSLRSEVKQVIKEELQFTLKFYADYNDENKAKIQKCEKSMKDLENHSVV